MSRHGAGYAGKLRSNFLGTEFSLYDCGDKAPAPAPALWGSDSTAAAAAAAGRRCELGAVLYQPNVLGSRGPRKMTVVLPKLEGGVGAGGGQRPLAVSPRGEHDTLLAQ